MEPAHLQDDLKQEVMLALLEKPEEFIKELHSKNGLKFYTARVIINMIQSNTSPFYKKYRGDNIEFAEQWSETTREVEFDVEAILKKEKLEEAVIYEIKNLYWYKKVMILLYLVNGNYRAIEDVTGVKWESAYNTIKTTMKEIREKVSHKDYKQPEREVVELFDPVKELETCYPIKRA